MYYLLVVQVVLEASKEVGLSASARYYPPVWSLARQTELRQQDKILSPTSCASTSTKAESYNRIPHLLDTTDTGKKSHSVVKHSSVITST